MSMVDTGPRPYKRPARRVDIQGALLQRSLPLDPPTELVIPVRDQRVPGQERGKLCRMSRAILERLERGPALALELQAMFPGARSVRTRISDVGRWVRPDFRLESEPVKGVVGEWRYWLGRQA